MKGLLKILLVVSAVVMSLQSAYAWGSRGHRMIGYVADMNLTPQARKMCNKYLGESLESSATWMDKVRYTEEYHHTARWHSVGVKNGEFVPSQLTGSKARYDTPMHDDDHGIARLLQIAEQMKEYRNLSDSTVAVNLKFIIHIVGDLHCPGHIFFADQSMQYSIKVGGKKIHYHTFLDKAYDYFNKGVAMADFYEQNCNLSSAEKRALRKGGVAEWVEKNLPIYRECYVLLPEGVEYDNLTATEQLRLKTITDRLYIEAGYRLAHIINKIFK
ncbi:MAG: S1/P1 nuclease [Alistipes sp.]|nr:S1/P1 nuclease [Alistipes sp.]